MIHVYNKNENSIHSSNYFDNLRHRGNILLLGDSLGDLRMADGAADLKCLLKIGFLNYKVCVFKRRNMPSMWWYISCIVSV